MNIVILSGNLTRDPEHGTTKSGIAFCRFGLAVQRKYDDMNGNPIVDFFECVAWRQAAEICAKYLTKGTKVTVTGSLVTNEYTARDGAKRKAYEIVVDNVEMSYTRVNEEQESAKTRTGVMPVDEDELPF